MMPAFLCPEARRFSPLAMEPGSPFENSSSPFHPCLVGLFESWFLKGCPTRSSRILVGDRQYAGILAHHCLVVYAGTL